MKVSTIFFYGWRTKSLFLDVFWHSMFVGKYGRGVPRKKAVFCNNFGPLLPYIQDHLWKFPESRAEFVFQNGKAPRPPTSYAYGTSDIILEK